MALAFTFDPNGRPVTILAVMDSEKDPPEVLWSDSREWGVPRGMMVLGVWYGPHGNATRKLIRDLRARIEVQERNKQPSSGLAP